jgi:tetratricopeptide (TPR) repeat protein
MRRYLALILFFISTWVIADDNASLIEKGNKAYTGRFYQQAIDCYLKVEKSGYESPELYYNLGNAYFKQNDFSAAILYYEKAKRLDPGDDDINYNLKVANTKIIDKIDAVQEFFLIRWYKNIASVFSFNTWAITAILMLVLFLGLLSLYLFSRSLKIKKLAFWSSGVALLITLLFFIFAQTQYSSLNNSKEAIIFTPSVTAKSSPDANSTDLFVMHEGTKVKVIDHVGEWSEIRIANGSVGWVNTSVFKVI